MSVTLTDGEGEGERDCVLEGDGSAVKDADAVGDAVVVPETLGEAALDDEVDTVVVTVGEGAAVPDSVPDTVALPVGVVEPDKAPRYRASTINELSA